MILSLFIRDYLLIPEIHIEFAAGLTTITGETGAGKSLIVDSLALAVGARGDSKIVRDGCEKAEIIVEFDASNERLKAWLQERDLTVGDDCVVRRLIHRDQPSKAYVNSVPVPMQTLRELGSFLIDIHSQHEHRLLMKQSGQRAILDGFANHLDTLSKLGKINAELSQKLAKRAEASAKKERLAEQVQVIDHQVSQLDELAPQDGEFSALEKELAALSGAEELSAALFGASQQLHYSEERSASSSILETERVLDRLADLNPDLKGYAAMLEEARLRVDDAARDLRAIAERTEHDPRRIAEVNERMAELQRVARIHQVSADGLPETLARLNDQADGIREELSGIESLDSEIGLLEKRYAKLAGKISDGRNAAAKTLVKKVNAHLQRLGMEKATFDIDLVAEEPQAYASFGAENVRFMVATNPGQQLDLLSKIASGGELSRLSLAIQVVAANAADASSIVFDEIDVGIGGKIADSVGSLLRELGGKAQVLCITHLPQVACHGHSQMSVTKTTGASADTDIRRLSHEERVSELARMLGGATITRRASEHAEEMLSASTT